MPTLTIPNSFTPNTTAVSADVNANFNAIATFLNSTKLDGDNIQADAIDKTLLASDVADGTTIEQAAGGELKIKDSGVSTAKLATGSVTQAKLAARTVTTNGTDPGAGGVVMSASCGAITISSSLADVSGLSVTLTTTGRPIMVAIVPDGSSNPCNIYSQAGAGTGTISCDQRVTINRGATVVGYLSMSSIVDAATTRIISNNPCIHAIDNQAAGTYTYKVQALGDLSWSGSSGTESNTLNYVKLVAFEL